MKTLYFDCSAGISGDMTLGALLDLGIDREKFLLELAKLNVEGYRISFGKAVKNGIGANKVDVDIELPGYDRDGQPLENTTEHHDHEHHHHEHDHDHEHHHHEHDHDHEHHHHEHDHDHEHHHHEHDHNHEHHHHEHRNLADVFKIIDNSGLSDNTKELSKKIFMRVAEAESKVHNEPLDKVHFHEVGAIDSIVDIVGTAICIDMLKPERIFASVVNDGHGFIMCQHGQIPVPVPATAQIFANSNVISRQIDVDTELVTPTGAAIISELAESFGQMPVMSTEKIGMGAGRKDIKIPNILRVFMGETAEMDGDIVTILETNVDDTTGEMMGYTMERLFGAGAKDVFYSPIFMKKNRPAYKLTVICTEDTARELENIIFMETTTIGIRRRTEKRTCLERSNDTIDTKYGRLDVKRIQLNGSECVYPEYASAKELARKNNVALREIYKM
ncbi:pyridinium-3,5-bisthiocarboxylic acid mononucleotide nickel insertion protein [Clostridiales bacterium]|nr:pyridinium-3,5-bisthiocarboxylic acid mononucleotide nickel insertion protein [Clostridiales bacterium]